MSEEIKLPNTEEVLLETLVQNNNSFDIKHDPEITEDVKKAMIEFAKLHVVEALKAASDKAKIGSEKRDYGGVRAGCKYHIPIINKQSILEAYPLENIK